MHWQNIVEKIAPYLVKVETPGGRGTGFLCLANRDKSILGIATAAHVVGHADEWQEPIRLRSFHTDKTAFLKEGQRVIRFNWAADSAVILFPAGDLDFPEQLIPLLPSSETLPIGVEIGWLGFPAIEAFTPCFFSGSISARRDDQSAYLIDGVAINGVSGGPVFYSTDADGLRIVGIITTYRANRATGDALPGLSYAQDVAHFHTVIESIRSLDDAKSDKAARRETKTANKPRHRTVPKPSNFLFIRPPFAHGRCALRYPKKTRRRWPATKHRSSSIHHDTAQRSRKQR